MKLMEEKELAIELVEIETLIKLLGALNQAKFKAEPKSGYSNSTHIVASFDGLRYESELVVKAFAAELNEAIKPLITKRKNLLRSKLAGLSNK